MSTCAICHDPIHDAGLADAETGAAFHVACAVQRLPEDLAVAALVLAAAVVVPAVLVWAG